jgi:hypothetical protein
VIRVVALMCLLTGTSWGQADIAKYGDNFPKLQAAFSALGKAIVDRKDDQTYAEHLKKTANARLQAINSINGTKLKIPFVCDSVTILEKQGDKCFVEIHATSLYPEVRATRIKNGWMTSREVDNHNKDDVWWLTTKINVTFPERPKGITANKSNGDFCAILVEATDFVAKPKAPLPDSKFIAPSEEFSYDKSSSLLLPLVVLAGQKVADNEAKALIAKHRK